MKTKTIILPMLGVVCGLGLVAFVSVFSSSPTTEKNIQTAETKSIISDSEGLNLNKTKQTPMSNYKIKKTEEEWKKQLTPEEYKVLREKGTERAFTGDLYHNHDKGVYTCAACHEKLFESKTKFESGSGWPSFYTAIEGNVEEITDKTHGMVRTEVVCNNCGSHLGHVFNDGPNPTGLRYCVNSISLDFEKEK